MPRIRKKTSNRGTTNDRKKIQHKVRESRRKAKKAAKKNPQWKSKTPKDPGIPNNFPFKDQILAEVSEERRIEAEEKQRRKEEKIALRAKVKNSTGDDEAKDGKEVVEEPGMELEELKGLQVGNDAIGAVGARRILNARTISKLPPVPIEREEEEEVPLLVNQELPNLRAVIEGADAVVEVLDARDPLSFRSSHLEELVADKPLLLVLNKIDTCPRESIVAWVAHLRTQHPTALFRSATAFLPSGPEASAPKIKSKGKNKAGAPAHDGLGVGHVLECLGEWAKAKLNDEPLVVAVLGVTNAGKSSFINSLLQKFVLPIYRLETSSRGPTTTELPQEVLLEVEGKKIKLIDTPGLSWEVDGSADNRENHRVHDILLRAKGRIDRLKDPTLAVTDILSRSSAEDLMLLYSLPAFPKDNLNSFLSGVARSSGLVKRRGNLDLQGALRVLLRDWSTGKFARYTTPNSPTATAARTNQDANASKAPATDDAILETLESRKDMRRKKGLVKLTSGAIESRKVVLDEPWWKEAHDDVNEDEYDGLTGSGLEFEEDEGEKDEDGDGEDEDENDEEADEIIEDDEGEEETFLPPLTSKKQKRKRVDEPSVVPPSKKVTFEPGPKTQPRKAGSVKRKTRENPAASSTRKSGPRQNLPVQERSVANVTTKSASSAGNDEAYDFGKFFL